MAADVQKQAEEKESAIALGKKELKLLSDPLNDNNPVTVQVLGICSALAVTSQVLPSLIMTLGVIFVAAFSNLFLSLLRKSVPGSIRMVVQLLIAASLVQVVEIVLGAFAYSVYESLSVFIGLIVTNCIIMGRMEAFAMGNRPWQAFLDGVGNGLGYGAILILMAVFRELFGKGTLMGMEIFKLTTNGGWYTTNGLLLLPCSSLFIISIIIWIHRSWNKKLVNIS
jgi:Na+-transporting NADH:ubiquinone oxidoreductase subunit D